MTSNRGVILYPPVECPNCGHALNLNPILRDYEKEIARLKHEVALARAARDHANECEAEWRKKAGASGV